MINTYNNRQICTLYIQFNKQIKKHFFFKQDEKEEALQQVLRVLAASNRKVAHVQGGQSMMPHVPSGQSMMPVGESSPRHSEKSHESGYNTTDNLSPQQMRVGSASPPSSNQGSNCDEVPGVLDLSCDRRNSISETGASSRSSPGVYSGGNNPNDLHRLHHGHSNHSRGGMYLINSGT